MLNKQEFYHCIRETDRGEKIIKTVTEREARKWLNKKKDYIPSIDSPDAYWYGIQSVNARKEYESKGYVDTKPIKIARTLGFLKPLLKFRNSFWRWYYR